MLLDPKLLDQFMQSGTVLQSQNQPHPLSSTTTTAGVIFNDESSAAASSTDRQLLNAQQCRILLSDIACCSLMRLDISSMDKLWDLMLMVFKWQLSISTVAEHPQRLLDLTFRHMDGIGRLLPEMRKTLLIDCTKRHLIEFWDTLNATERTGTITSLQRWLRPYNVKISILIRLGFQLADGGAFVDAESAEKSEFFQYYADNVGENIYTKHAYVTAVRRGGSVIVDGDEKNEVTHQLEMTSKSHEIDALAAQLNGDEASDGGAAANEAAGAIGGYNTAQQPLPTVLEEGGFNYGDAFQKMRIIVQNNEGASMFKKDFVNIQTVSTIDSIMESFSLDFIKARGDAGIVEEFDATRELLKLLDLA